MPVWTCGNMGEASMNYESKLLIVTCIVDMLSDRHVDVLGWQH